MQPGRFSVLSQKKALSSAWELQMEQLAPVDGRLLRYLGLRFVLYLNVAAECKGCLRAPGGIIFVFHYT